MLRGRSWAWLRLQIEELLNLPPTVVYDPWRRPVIVPATRLGIALDPLDLTPPAEARRAQPDADADAP